MDNPRFCNYHQWRSSVRRPTPAEYQVQCGDYETNVCKTHLAKCVDDFLTWTAASYRNGGYRDGMPLCKVDKFARHDPQVAQ